MNKPENVSSLGAFHAKAMGDGPMAGFEFKYKVPAGYHGVFVPQT